MYVHLGSFTRRISDIAPDLVVEHRSYLDDRCEAGEIICSGPRVPSVGGLIIVRGTDAATGVALPELTRFILVKRVTSDVVHHQNQIGPAVRSTNDAPALRLMTCAAGRDGFRCQ